MNAVAVDDKMKYFSADSRELGHDQPEILVLITRPRAQSAQAIQGKRQQLEPKEDRQQIRGAGHQHRAGRAPEHERDAGSGLIVASQLRGHQEREDRSHDDNLFECDREAAVDERAAERRERVMPAAQRVHAR